MAITPVGVGTFTETASSTTITPPLPAGVTTGDLMVVVIACGEDSPQPAITSAPAGWTQRGTDMFTDYGPGGMSQWVYWKIHDGSEADPSFTLNTGDSNGGGIWAATAAFRGVHQTDPFALASPSQGQSAAASTFTPPDVVTEYEDSMLVSLLSTSDNNELNLSAANGFTLSGIAGAGYSSTLGSDGALGMAYKLVGVAGTYSLPTWNQSAVGPDSWSYQTLALRDANSVDVTVVAPSAIDSAQAIGSPALIPAQFILPVAIAAPGGTAYAATILADSPSAYFRLGEPSGTTMTDATGSHSGTYQGSPTLGESGAIADDTSVAFGYVTTKYGLTSWYDIPAHPATLETWIKWDGVTFPQDGSLGGWFDVANTRALQLFVTGNGTSTVNLRIGVEVGNANYDAQAILADGEWHHIVGTIDASKYLRLYIDGVLRAGPVLSSYPGGGTSVNPLCVGRTNTAATRGSNSWPGWQDEFATYPVALTQAQIEAHYAARSTTEAIGAPTLAQGAASSTIAPTGISSGETVSSPAIASISDQVIIPTAIAAPGAPYSSVILADSPIAYYRLGEASGLPQDSSGNAHHATAVIGTPVYSEAGALTGDADTAIFYGMGEGHTVPNTEFSLGDGPFSVEAWVKRADLNTQIFYFYFGNRGITGTGWYIGFDSTGRLIGYNDGPGTFYLSTETFEDTNWHHIVFTKNGAERVAYADGTLLTNTAANSTVGDEAKPWGIGNNGATGNDYDGDLDELAVYGYVLTSTQVEDHHAAGSGGGTAVGSPTVSVGAFALNIAPTAINSSEALGTINLLPGTVAVSPTAIASAEVVGSATLLHGGVTVLPTAIAGAESVGTSTLVPGGVVVLATAIGSAEATGSPVLTTEVSISVSAIDSSENLGSPILQSRVSIIPTAIDSGESLGSLILKAGISINPTSIDSSAAIGMPVLTTEISINPVAIDSSAALGSLVLKSQTSINPTAIESTENLGSPILATQVSINPTAIASGQVLGTAVLISGGISVLPSAIGSAELVGTPLLQAFGGPRTIISTEIGSAEAVDSPTLLPGNVTVAQSSISSAEAVGSPGLIASADILPTSISSAESVGSLTLTATSTIISTGVSSVEAVGTPILGVISTIIPTGITSEVQLGTPTVQPHEVGIVITGISSEESLGNPILAQASGPRVIAPDNISSGQIVGSLSLLPGTAYIAPVGVTSEATTGSLSVLPGGQSIGPASVTPGESLGTPSITVGTAWIIPVGVSTGAALGIPILGTSGAILVTGISTSELLGSPLVLIEDLGSAVIPTGITTAELLGSPQLIPGITFIQPSGIESAEDFAPVTVLGKRAGWKWVNKSPAMAGVREAGWPTLQDSFARPRKDEGEG